MSRPNPLLCVACSTPPTLPPNAVFGACADVATTPLENKNTCDLKCAEGYQQTVRTYCIYGSTGNRSGAAGGCCIVVMLPRVEADPPLRVFWHMQDGSLGYTCKDGELDNADPPVCEPTCQTVQCSSLTTSYFLATVPMKRRDERFDTTICVGDCVEYCCEGMFPSIHQRHNPPPPPPQRPHILRSLELSSPHSVAELIRSSAANPPTVPVPTAGTGFAKNENALSGTYCKSVPNPAGGVFSRSNKNWCVGRQSLQPESGG
jgi:hypothetical protein